MMTPTSPESNDKIDVFALLRKSTDAQDIERQRYELEALKEEHNLNYVEVIELNGISGTSMLTNPQVKRIEEKFATMPHIRGMAASSVDRLFRPQKGSDFGILNMFTDNKKILWTHSDGVIDCTKDDAFDRLVSAGSRAGKELREIRRRSINGKNKNAKAGYLNSGSVPFGYLYIPSRGRIARAHMIPHPTEAPVVQQCYAWAICGIGVYEIARRLNEQGILSKRAGKVNRKARPAEHAKGACAERQNDGKWSPRTVYQMLTQRCYMGVFAYHKGRPDEIKISVPAIVEEALWQDVQLALPENKKTRTGPHVVRNYLLTGLGWCKHCGWRLTSKTRRTHSRGYYICAHTSNKPPRKCLCIGPLPYIDKDALESAVWNSVWATVANEDTLVGMINAAYADVPVDENVQAEATKIRLQVEEAKLCDQRAHENMRDPRYPRQLGLSEWEESQRTLRDAQFRLAQCESLMMPRNGNKPDEAAVRGLAKELAATEPQGFEQRRAFLRLVIGEFITDGTNVEIELSIPFEMVRDFHTPGEGMGNNVCDSGIYSHLKRCQGNTSSSSVPLAQPITLTINTLLR